MVSFAAVENFFFECSRRGWACPQGDPLKVTKTSIPGLPGSKVYERGDEVEGGFLRYIDCFFVNGRQSFGSTIIYFRYGDVSPWEAVWFMQYNGATTKASNDLVIERWKGALFTAYTKMQFCGGRGVPGTEWKDAELLYVNNWRGSFWEFSGHEEMIRTDNRDVACFHDFHGRLIAGLE